MTKPEIFIVEDDELMRELLIHMLQREGYPVKAYADGRQAQQALQQAQQAPGLFLLDVMLPHHDGFAIVNMIREEKKWQQPIVMLTAKSQEAEIVRALEAGASDYIVKPFQVNELMARLRRFLRAAPGVA
ncbi:response regulator transcription factor [Massilia sp. W12]|uniref:response regulator transcription factor n=1 Tax=Massilia sp. W12 TaxID=3126507 RepID=UPI0030CEEF2D